MKNNSIDIVDAISNKQFVAAQELLGDAIQEKLSDALISRKDEVALDFGQITNEEKDYEAFFQKAMKKFGISSPADLKTDEKKKEFFNYIDKNFKAINEEDEEMGEEEMPKSKMKTKSPAGRSILMLLITEVNDNVKLVTEEVNGEKQYHIDGIFMQAEQKNRNGRVYPKKTLMKEVQRYNNEYVKTNRAMGELGHPDGPQLNLERVSHLIKELRVDGNDIYGRAKILDTPYGKIVKDLVKEGVKIGVSSRGMGSLKQVNGVNEVQDDFNLAAVDIVADPSAPDAFVEGIMEGKEWVWENGILTARRIESYKKQIKSASKSNLEEAKLYAFADFLSNYMKDK